MVDYEEAFSAQADESLLYPAYKTHFLTFIILDPS
jgi:hypothetical protein